MKKKYKSNSVLREIFGNKVKSKPPACPICRRKLALSSISHGFFNRCYHRYICWKCLKVSDGEGNEECFPTANIVLKEVGGEEKIIVKIVRHLTKRGLKETRDLINAVASQPQIIIKDVHEEIAKRIKDLLEATGAKVEIKEVEELQKILFENK